MKKNHSNLLITGLCTVALFTGTVNMVQASTIAFSPTGLSQVTPPEGVGNDGIFFTPTTAISVTALGYIAPSESGNQVGIFDVSTHVLLASTTVTISDPTAGGFYWDSITPVLLAAGNQYAVVGLWTTIPNGFNANGGVGAADGINFDGYKYDASGVLDLPDIGYQPTIFGPNFQFDAVPDGGMTVVLLGGALMGLAAVRRKLSFN